MGGDAQPVTQEGEGQRATSVLEQHRAGEEQASTLIITQSPVVGEGLARLLSDAGYICRTGALSGGEMVPYTAGSPDIVLIEGTIASSEIVAAVRTFRHRFPAAKIAVLSSSYGDDHLLEVVRAGADGLMLTRIGWAALVQALHLLALGEHVFPSEVLQLLCSRQFPPPVMPDLRDVAKILSSRELEVLNGLSKGRANKIIARQFGITESTVKVHVKAILRKIQVKNRTEAALWARNHGLDSIEVLASGNWSGRRGHDQQAPSLSS